MRTIVFINSHSRQAAANLQSVMQFLAEPDNPFDVQEFIVIEKLADFGKYLKRLQRHKNIACVIIGSGDGTIVSVLNALRRRKDIVYGFLPLGTSNTFVRSLGLPLDFKKALRVLSNGQVRPVSLGDINGTLFANIADIGIPAHVADNLTNKHKKYLGPLAYVFSTIRELIRHDPVWCELKVNGERKTFYTHQLYVANGKYRGPIPVGQDASAYAESLLLGYSTSQGRWGYVRDAFALLLGRTEKPSNNLFLVPFRTATLRTCPAQIIQADGEVIGKTPAKIKIIKDAIRVLTPPELPKGTLSS